MTISSERREALKEADPELTDEKIDEEIQATRDEVRETHTRNLERAKDQFERLGIHHTCTSAFDQFKGHLTVVPMDMIRLLDDTTDALEIAVRERDVAVAQAEELVDENLALQELVLELRSAA